MTHQKRHIFKFIVFEFETKKDVTVFNYCDQRVELLENLYN